MDKLYICTCVSQTIANKFQDKNPPATINNYKL